MAFNKHLTWIKMTEFAIQQLLCLQRSLIKLSEASVVRCSMPIGRCRDREGPFIALDEEHLRAGVIRAQRKTRFYGGQFIVLWRHILIVAEMKIWSTEHIFRYKQHLGRKQNPKSSIIFSIMFCILIPYSRVRIRNQNGWRLCVLITFCLLFLIKWRFTQYM